MRYYGESGTLPMSLPNYLLARSPARISQESCKIIIIIENQKRRIVSNEAASSMNVTASLTRFLFETIAQKNYFLR
jgi:hypothetical protein